MISKTTTAQPQQIPAPVKTFLLRALVLVMAWCLVYIGLLKPQRVPDRWLSNTTAAATAKALSIGYAPARFAEKDGFACVVMGERSVIRIGDPCNALDLMALYVAFIICLPSAVKRMLLFSVSGIAAIFVLNVLRCYSLAWITINKNEWLDFAHKYAFTAIVYCFIFYGWIVYLRSKKTIKAVTANNSYHPL